MTAGLPTLLLTTMGRKSGQPRSAPLVYLRYGDGWAVAGTNFGGTSHPAWYLNLKVNPQAELLVEGEQVTVSARDALQDERADLWSRPRCRTPGRVKGVDRKYEPTFSPFSQVSVAVYKYLGSE